MTETTRALTAIFANTNDISAGPFRLRKGKGQSVEHAKFSVGGVFVSVAPAHKKVMAMLISQDTVTTTFFINAMDTPKFEIMARKMQDNSPVKPSRKDIQDAENALTVRISQIKKAIRETLGDRKASVYNDMIRSTTIQGHRQPHEEAGYKITLDV